MFEWRGRDGVGDHGEPTPVPAPVWAGQSITVHNEREQPEPL